MLLTPAAILSVTASQTLHVILSVSIATFGIGWWGANCNALLMDSVPRHSLASVAGVAGTAGSVGSVIVTWLTGLAADRNAYFLVFWGNSVLICLSVASTWLLLRKPVEREMIASPLPD
jgi:nitrate/nitrite transporter NarK